MLTSALRHLAPTSLIATALLVLTACGGGSGGGGPTSPNPQPTPPDTDPTAFTFAAKGRVDLGATVESETVEVQGINVPLTVSVEGGEYSLNGDDAFTSEESELEEGDTLRLRGTAPETPEESHTVTVTVGDYTTTFDIVARSDSEAPQAAFAFPPPMTATEGDTVIVRGTAEDDWSDISRVTLTVSHDGGVNDYEVDTENEFATWQKPVTLGPGENRISIQTEDALGNTLDEAERESVTVVQQPFEEAFPDDEVAIELPQTLVFDEEHERILVTDYAENRIVAVDLESGVRSVFLQLDEGNDINSAYSSGLVLDAPRNRLLLSGNIDVFGEREGILSIDLDTKEVAIVNSRSTPTEDQPAFSSPTGMAFNPTDSNQVFLLARGSRNLAMLDLSTGLRTLVSDNEMPESGPGFDSPRQLLVDPSKDRALVAQSSVNGILSVDLSTGVREVFLAEGEPEGTPEFFATAMVSDDLEERVLIQDIVSQEIWSVDIESRAITVVSGDGQPHSQNPLGWFIDMELSPNKEFIVGVHQRSGSANVLYAIDLVTGERLVLSKPTGDVE